MKSFMESLEFNKVTEIINDLCKTNVGKNKTESLFIFSDASKLQSELDLLKEMISLIIRFNELPIENSALLSKIVDYAQKVGILSVYDLESICHDITTISRIQAAFKKTEDNYLKLQNLINDFKDISYIEQQIHSVISPNLTIYDDASSELKRIRRTLISLESDLSIKVRSLVKIYQEYLTDNTVTLRNGHYVLPVKTSYKFKIEGIIHDTSDSGNTVFVEPSLIVELNNKIASLKIEEADEINKILRQLTQIIIKEKDAVIHNNLLLGYLDFLSAKAKYALEFDGVVGNISSERILKLKEARHPLISKDRVVANDFYLDENKHILIISGPNAGGKSVALKTVGLLSVMHQAGLPILARDGAEIPFFKRIYVDIGDQQSLNDSLSTFSAHMQNLIDMSQKLGAKDLVIIDELGTGTDPQEGEALAKSILDYLHFKHAMALVSSHYMGVKTYALDNSYVENASMIFDETNFMPTYKLRLGIPGKSYGMEVASRLGLDNSIIQKAQKYLKENKGNLFATSLSKLDSLVLENEKITKEANAIRTSLKDKEEFLQRQSKELSERKKNLLKEVEDEKEKLLEETRLKVEEILHNLDKEELKMHEVIEAKAQIDKLEDNQKVEIKNNVNLKINDYVEIDEMNLSGTIIRVIQDKLTIQTEIGKIEVNSNEVTKIVKPQTKRKKNEFTSIDRQIISRSVPLECNLIGKHVDEALNELAKYLDDVVIKGYQQVRIIHGSGTGTLRKVVHEYLDKQKYIKSYRLGGLGEGGVGATVVYLK